MQSTELLSLIESVLDTTGIAPSRFGFDAIGERQLVKQLREGREPREETRKKILAHIARITTPSEMAIHRQLKQLRDALELAAEVAKDIICTGCAENLTVNHISHIYGLSPHAASIDHAVGMLSQSALRLAAAQLHGNQD